MTQPTITDAECLELVLSRIVSDPTHPRHQQVMAKLKNEPREAVARFAAGCAQIKSLHLAPWQFPPADMDDPEEFIVRGPHDANYKTALLSRRMLKRGISRYHPNPLET